MQFFTSSLFMGNVLQLQLQEYFLDNPVFRLETILKSINKLFEKQLQRYPFLSQVVPNLPTKSLKNTWKKICILESGSVSINKIFEMHLWKNYFLWFTILLVIFVIVNTLLWHQLHLLETAIFIHLVYDIDKITSFL